MDIKLLGQLSAHLNQRSVVPSAAKPRQILALLALNAGRVVPVRTICEELWGDHAPRSASTTLQTYILQLRGRITAALGADPRHAKSILVTRHGGYALEVAPDRVDVHEFRQLARSARGAYDAGDVRTAAALYDSALALWQGSALMDVQIGRALELEASALEQERAAALEQRIGADLELGRHTELLGELFTLVARHPMHENLCAQLMTALYRAGHTGRALESFQRLRHVLVSELGVEPSARLRRLQQAILAGDPALDLPFSGELVPGRVPQAV
ncbi:AfsR/SARP family transcriptional regulator [Streptomyces sp. FH025]|uniref:AfsR/SARP family transcriptional regulator n=1 Tax=Streptomyces sp. FH025 TaxID=2815937 RepID=UPI001A9E6258|nr:AfsR/SARP family transcriptional regulator [Streptomyces sp. FH025]MBO1413062.1 AfsR/SARP family transcriptional regulator [Streptomyces sp. FH025]